MKANRNKEIEDILNRGEELTVADFFAACPGLPPQTVYSRIRSLLLTGTLSRIGRGRYVVARKPKYEVPITDWMLEVNDFLINNCEGVNHCISQRGENLFVEVSRHHISTVAASLRQRYEKVVLKKEYERFPAPLDGFVIVGLLVTEAPVAEVNNCRVPSLEKELVDSLSEHSDELVKVDFQRALEVFPVNVDRLGRYASRRGVVNELVARLSEVDSDRVELFTNIQRYFSTLSSVNKAWLFGSFARQEETPESDIDILVDYFPDAKVSLLDIIRQKLDLEKITGREVDLVENGYLKPFALQSAERDKYLIYER